MLKENGVLACQLAYGMAAWKLGGYKTVSGPAEDIDIWKQKHEAQSSHAEEQPQQPDKEAKSP